MVTRSHPLSRMQEAIAVLVDLEPRALRGAAAGLFACPPELSAEELRAREMAAQLLEAAADYSELVSPPG